MAQLSLISIVSECKYEDLGFPVETLIFFFVGLSLPCDHECLSLLLILLLNLPALSASLNNYSNRANFVSNLPVCIFFSLSLPFLQFSSARRCGCSCVQTSGQRIRPSIVSILVLVDDKALPEERSSCHSHVQRTPFIFCILLYELNDPLKHYHKSEYSSCVRNYFNTVIEILCVGRNAFSIECFFIPFTLHYSGSRALLKGTLVCAKCRKAK